MIKKHNQLSSIIYHRFNKGFTLIEILVVATIIGLLSALAIANFSTANKSSRDAKRKADLEQVRTALEIYRSQNGSYPTTGSGSWTDLSNLSALITSDYIANLPVDPLPSTHTSYKSYRYKATDNYYGYCLAAKVEVIPTQAPCTPDSGYNYSVRHP